VRLFQIFVNATHSWCSIPVRSTQLELDEEIKRSTSLSAQLADRPSVTRGGANSGDVTKSEIKLAFYEDLTTIKIHSVKQFDSEELGRVTELECDCTTYQKSMFNISIHYTRIQSVLSASSLLQTADV
jgi:hypothetical protein